MRPKKRKSHRLQSSGEVLQSLFKNGKEPLGKTFEQMRLWTDWGDIVGPTIAKCTRPVQITGGVLYVHVDSASRMQELTFVVGDLLSKINRHFGRNLIRQIRFTL